MQNQFHLKQSTLDAMPLRDSIGSTGALFPLELTSDLTAAQELAAA